LQRPTALFSPFRPLADRTDVTNIDFSIGFFADLFDFLTRHQFPPLTPHRDAELVGLTAADAQSDRRLNWGHTGSGPAENDSDFAGRPTSVNGTSTDCVKDNLKTRAESSSMANPGDIE